jgi:hypothetical protein
MGWTHNAPPVGGTERYDHRHDWRIPCAATPRSRHRAVATSAQKQWGELRNVMAGTTIIAGSGGADGLLPAMWTKTSSIRGLTFADVYYNTFPLGDSNGTLPRETAVPTPNIDAATVLNNDCYFPHVLGRDRRRGTQRVPVSFEQRQRRP